MAGVDVSEMAKLEQHGAVYRIHGTPESPYAIFQQDGINWMRVRIFLNPSGVGPLCNDLPYTLKLAQSIKAHGFHLLLDFHYSDGWADPSQQYAPRAWAGLDHDQLVEKVRSYTQQTIQTFALQQATPDMVEIGNEITNGMLWPDGKVMPRSMDATAWAHLTDLLRAGVDGVRASAPEPHRPLIMVHIDRGGDPGASRLFYDHLRSADVDFDVIGLSDYPWWQGSLAQLKANLDQLAARYHKRIVVVETAYPFSPQSGSEPGQLYKGDATVDRVLHYPSTPEGQAEYLQQMIDTVRSTPNGLGVGVFYWAAAWIQANAWGAPSWSKYWEDRALFDHNGNALPALKVLGDAAAAYPQTVSSAARTSR